jgi:ABC-type glycerol-3-phosphate transport system substrate-binding protein
VATPRVTPTADPNVIVIEYSVRGHDDWDAVIALAEAFNESQDRIRVNATTRLLPVAPGTATDLIDMAREYDCFVDGFYPQGTADRHGDVFFEALYNLSPLFEAEESAFQDDFMPNLLERSQVDGALYGLPVAVYPVVLRYNSDLLAQRGIAPPDPDWTVEEFWDLVREAGSGSAYGLIAIETIYPDELLSFVPGAAFYFDLDTQPMRPKFTDPAVVGALTFLGEMAEAGVFYPDVSWASRRTWQEEMGSGQMLLINTGRAAVWAHRIGSGAGDGGPRVAYGAVPYPQRTLPNYFSQEGSGTYQLLYISRRSPDPTACWEWFQFLFEHPDIFLGLPARQSIRESAAWRESVGEQTAVAYETMYFRPHERLLGIGMLWEIWAYRTWWADALLSVFEGEDPSLVLAEAQRRAEAFYDCYAPLDEPTFAQVQECARQADPNFQK